MHMFTFSYYIKLIIATMLVTTEYITDPITN